VCLERKTTARSISGTSQKDRRCLFGAMVKFLRAVLKLTASFANAEFY
jgi:hypothetical protein